MGGGWQGDAGSKLTRSGCVVCDWFGEYVWFSVVGPELEAGTKDREVVDQVLTIPGQLVQRLWVRILSFYLVWPLSIYPYCFWLGAWIRLRELDEAPGVSLANNNIMSDTSVSYSGLDFFRLSLFGEEPHLPCLHYSQCGACCWCLMDAC